MHIHPPLFNAWGAKAPMEDEAVQEPTVAAYDETAVTRVAHQKAAMAAGAPPDDSQVREAAQAEEVCEWLIVQEAAEDLPAEGCILTNASYADSVDSTVCRINVGFAKWYVSTPAGGYKWGAMSYRDVVAFVSLQCKVDSSGFASYMIYLSESKLAKQLEVQMRQRSGQLPETEAKEESLSLIHIGRGRRSYG